MAIVVDAHSDLLNDLLKRRAVDGKGLLESVWLPAMQAGGIDLRVAAIFSFAEFVPECGIPLIVITPIGHHDRSEATLGVRQAPSFSSFRREGPFSTSRCAL